MWMCVQTQQAAVDTEGAWAKGNCILLAAGKLLHLDVVSVRCQGLCVLPLSVLQEEGIMHVWARGQS